MTLRTFTLTAASVLLLGTAAFAQTSTTTIPPAKKPGLLSRMLHHHKTPAPAATPMTPVQSATTPMTGGSLGRTPGTAGSATPIAGGIIGNKKSHVYHLASDKSLPGVKNRVYFHTVAEAVAAGYHAGGQSKGSPSTKTGHGKHGAPMTMTMPVPAAH